MRILIVSQYFWPEEFRINDVADALSARGHQVEVLTGWPNYPSGKVLSAFRADPRTFRSRGRTRIVRVPLVPRGAGGGVRLALNYFSFMLTGMAAAFVMARQSRYDAVLVFQTSPVTAALPALVLRALTRAPVALWVQDLWPDTLEAVGAVRSSAGLTAVGDLVRFIYRRCDLILVQSRAFVDKVRRRADSRTPIQYLPNWTDIDVDAAEPCPAEELASYLGGFNLMFAGNLGEAQDLPAVVQAADLCRDLEGLRWLVVGDGRVRAALQEEVARRGLEDRVIFLGHQPSARMPEFFAAADALLVSLKPEPVFAMTVPSKVQAYLAAGRPILGMLDGEGARIIEESGGGLTAPAGDAAALAARVRELAASSADQRHAMGLRAKAYCREHFDREMLFDRLEDWLSRMGGGGKLECM